jgi:biotin carboxyl carrier protein
MTPERNSGTTESVRLPVGGGGSWRQKNLGNRGEMGRIVKRADDIVPPAPGTGRCLSQKVAFMQISSTAYPNYNAQLQQAAQAQQVQQTALAAAQPTSSTDSDGNTDGSVATAAPVASPAPGTGLVLDVSA